VGNVGTSLQGGRLEQLEDRVVGRVAVEGVGVLVAGDHELLPSVQTTLGAFVVVDERRRRLVAEVVGPEADLVVFGSSGSRAPGMSFHKKFRKVRTSSVAMGYFE